MLYLFCGRCFTSLPPSFGMAQLLQGRLKGVTGAGTIKEMVCES